MRICFFHIFVDQVEFKNIVMKNFFASLLGTLVGLVVFFLLMFFILIAFISVVSTPQDPKPVSVNSVLKLTLETPLIDRTRNSPWDFTGMSSLENMRVIGLNDVLTSIARAGDDPNIKGIYMELSTVQAGTASLGEVRQALEKFKLKGKFVMAYASYYSQKAYYLASVADKIYMNPEGNLLLTGISYQAMFFKGTFEKLGIEPQLIRHGKYKSAGEMLINEKMSEENKEQVSTYIGSLWSKMAADIAVSRGIQVEEINEWISGLKVSSPTKAVDLKLVDALKYKDEVIQELDSLSGGVPVDQISLKKYVVSAPSSGTSKNVLALVYAEGDIVTGRGDDENIGADKYAETLREIRNDSTVKAVLFRINSGGGSALASEIIWRELKLIAKDKKLIVSMGNVAASGGYYIACPAHKIMASEATLTGSIGVFGVLFNGKEFLNKKLGITTEAVNTHPYSDLGSFSRPLEIKEREVIQMEVDRIYESFVQRVAEGRGLEEGFVNSIAQGRVWAGKNALDIKLIDQIGGLEDALAETATLAGLTEYRVVEYPKLKEPWEVFINSLAEQAQVWWHGKDINSYLELLPIYQNIKNFEGIQARMSVYFEN